MRFLHNIFASKTLVPLFFDRFQVCQRLESNSILSQLFLEDFVDKAIIEDGGGKVCKYEYCNITDRSLLLCVYKLSFFMELVDDNFAELKRN